MPEPPASVRVIRTLGHGRAARAQLVEATMTDGCVRTCVEKVFAPGLLTRVIYRLSFQAPFAYQSNEDAIRTCFFRRRVAAAVIAATDTDAEIAQPLYVRFDESEKAWVLAADWIDGRGIKPAPTDASRIKRWFDRVIGRGKSEVQQPTSEIDQLVELMTRLEETLGQSGLVGSGWQVAPRALVSTANLLRREDRYTIIDLESGIPAVLVPQYILQGLRRATLPPFDDLDPKMLRRWFAENERLLTFRIGPDGVAQLGKDLDALIEHSTRWKTSEMAVFRRPWRHLTRAGRRDYQAGCIRRWEQDGVIDAATAESLSRQPLKARAIWWAGMAPSKIGRFFSRMIGNHDYRARAIALLGDRAARQARFQKSIARNRDRWIESGRLSETAEVSKTSFFVHWFLQFVTPRVVHRLTVDREARRQCRIRTSLLLSSPRYQSYFGGQRVEAAIERWQDNHRISAEEAASLREELCGNEVLAYTRGFGMHLALKTLAPVILPAKVGGVAAFIASGNLWFLLPMFATPFLRTCVTLWSLWTTRHQQIAHGEALVTGLLPVVGSVAFPLQMFSARPSLSSFLIRDAASKLGRRVPVYGGADSRTELAMIRATDLLIEVMQSIANRLPSKSKRGHDAADVDRPLTVAAAGPTIAVAGLPGPASKTAFGRWLDRHAIEQIRWEQRQRTDSPLADSDGVVHPSDRIAA